ncbi:MAG: HEAT repeat domain-containing protein [Chlamydiae bacterium]|nr:HEAT repeat domain-containing protein [Chlamydiota bacterium]
MLKHSLIIFGCFNSLLAGTIATENDFVSRIQAQLVIKDFNAAIDEAKMGLSLFPDSKEVLASLIKAYSRSGRSQEALAMFEKFSSLENLDIKNHFSLLEELAWGVLKDGTFQPQTTHMHALVGAFLTHDVKAVPFFIDALRSSNAYLRALAARLSAQYRDKLLGLELIRLIKEEKNWFVRLEALSALEGFCLKEARPLLEDILSSKDSSAEEKMLAIKAMASFYKNLGTRERKELFSSARTGFRQLGLELVRRFRMNDVADEVLQLIEDPSLYVRISALKLLASMKLDNTKQELVISKIDKLLEDPHPAISLTSAWVMMQYDAPKAAKVFADWLSCKEPRNRRLAASVLSSTGFIGSIYVQKHFYEAQDPFVKANLALGMLGQRTDVSVACDYLFGFLKQTKQQIAFDHHEHPIFASLEPSQQRHVPHIPRYPLLVDQFTRLDILNRLTIVGYEKSEEAIRNFLQEGIWAIIGSTAGVLIEEGSFQAIELIRKLLDDQDERVVLQAALALAFFAKDTSVKGILENAFEKVEWDHQVYILNALGAIGDRDSIPFLLNILHKPFQELRIVAASSIIQCLYH